MSVIPIKYVYTNAQPNLPTNASTFSDRNNCEFFFLFGPMLNLSSFNGNNTINYFTNNGFQVLKQKIAIAII
jgi:hypothetical protein